MNYDNSKIINLIDLTSLNHNDSRDLIANLSLKAKNNKVAAICVYPQYVSLAKFLLQDFNIKVATVANFPSGEQTIDTVLDTVNFSLSCGADEIDLVIPYKEYNEKGESQKAVELIKECKLLCCDKVLKVIIESSELKSQELIRKATKDAIFSRADFIKTSTGKVKSGAILEDAKTILEAIKEYSPQIDRRVGFKISGGVRTKEEAQEYLKLASNIMGENFLTNKTLRFGASSLLDNILKCK